VYNIVGILEKILQTIQLN